MLTRLRLMLVEAKISLLLDEIQMVGEHEGARCFDSDLARQLRTSVAVALLKRDRLISRLEAPDYSPSWMVKAVIAMSITAAVVITAAALVSPGMLQ